MMRIGTIRIWSLVWIGVACSAPSYTDPDTDTEIETDTDSDSDTDSDTDTDVLPTEIVRFIALGDGGTGGIGQYNNAEAIKSVCDELGCQFAIYLGDNFYDDGVSSVDDPQWQEKFELPYANLDFPFYAALGNHDNGGFGGAGFEFWKGDIQIDYAASGMSDKFKMPDRYYNFLPENSPIEFFALDTNAIFWDDDVDEQGAWLSQKLSESAAKYTIAFGHHPYLSNGRHGNAGEYEGIPYIPFLSGISIRDFMDDYVVGQIDMYICGHDHNRQWLESSGGTEWIVSGAAAKTTDLEGRGNTTFFEDDTQEGFLWVEATDTTLTGRFYNVLGELEYEQTLSL